MTGDLSKFDKFEEIDDGGIVKLSNGIPCMMKSKGSLILNDKIRYDDAYWVQGQKCNILSVSQLNNSGHKLEF